jgi:hypothetical protein
MHVIHSNEGMGLETTTGPDHNPRPKMKISLGFDMPDLMANR